YFSLPRGPRLITHCCDAADFLRQAEAARCDLLITDLYQAGGLDPLVLQADFLVACQRHLQPDRALGPNLCKEYREKSDCLLQLKQRFAPGLQTTTADGNWILWASRAAATDKKSAQIRSKALSPAARFNLWNAVKGFYRHR